MPTYAEMRNHNHHNTSFRRQRCHLNYNETAMMKWLESICVSLTFSFLCLGLSFLTFFFAPFLKGIPFFLVWGEPPSIPLPKTQLPSLYKKSLTRVVPRYQKEGIFGCLGRGWGGQGKKEKRMHNKVAFESSSLFMLAFALQNSSAQKFAILIMSMLSAASKQCCLLHLSERVPMGHGGRGHGPANSAICSVHVVALL